VDTTSCRLDIAVNHGALTLSVIRNWSCNGCRNWLMELTHTTGSQSTTFKPKCSVTEPVQLHKPVWHMAVSKDSRTTSIYNQFHSYY